MTCAAVAEHEQEARGLGHTLDEQARVRKYLCSVRPAIWTVAAAGAGGRAGWEIAGGRRRRWPGSSEAVCFRTGGVLLAAGEGQEDFIEIGVARGDLVDRDAGGLQGRDGRRQSGCPVAVLAGAPSTNVFYEYSPVRSTSRSDQLGDLVVGRDGEPEEQAGPGGHDRPGHVQGAAAG